MIFNTFKNSVLLRVRFGLKLDLLLLGFPRVLFGPQVLVEVDKPLPLFSRKKAHSVRLSKMRCSNGVRSH